MKRLRILSLILLVLCIAAFTSVAASAESITINSGIPNVRGIFKNTFTIFSSSDPITFDLDVEFSKPTTTFNATIARLSSAMSAIESTNNKYGAFQVLASAMGFTSCEEYNLTKATVSAATGHCTSIQTIQRNGKPCKLIQVTFNEKTKGDYATMVSDLLLVDEKTSGLTSEEAAAVKKEIYDSGEMCSFTDASAYHLEEMKKQVPADGDFIFWLSGGMRAGAIANDLARRLIDIYGTEHVVCYTFGSMNVSKNALQSEDTSKYNSIFAVSNSDDAVCQLPLASWGFQSWGVDITLGFPETSNIKNTAFYQELNSIYRLYGTDDVSQYSNAYPSRDYGVYDDNEANGIAVQSFLDSMQEMIPSIQDYYEKELSINAYKSVAVLLIKWDKNIEKKSVESLYAYLKKYVDMANKDEIDSGIVDLLCELKGSVDFDCSVNKMLNYGMKHGFHANSSGELLTQGDLLTSILNVNGFKLPLYEAVTGFLQESYLSWMSVSDPTRGFLTALPSDSASSSMTSNDVMIAGEKVFYSDQGFTATKTEDGYKLAFGYVSGASCAEAGKITPCNPYNEVTLTIPAPAYIRSDCTVSYNGKALDMTYANGKLSAKVNTLNGTLEFPVQVETGGSTISITVSPELDATKATETVLLVVYNADGQMVSWTTAEIDADTNMAELENTASGDETAKIMFVDSNLNPTYTALLLS